MSYNIRESRETGAGALAFSLDPAHGWMLHQVLLHLSAVGGAGTLTIAKDAAAGAAYDVVLLSQDMTAVTDIVYHPERPLYFANGDKLTVTWANAGGKTYGLEVDWL